MRTSSWLVAALVILVLGGCDGSDAPKSDGQTATVPVAEVDLHDGKPCPLRLPDSEPSTYGLGTSQPAGSAPKLDAPHEAWVCVYGAEDDGPGPDGDGTTFTWMRVQGPVQVRQSSLPDLTQQLADLKPADKDRVCNMDLGRRFFLVYRHGNDLTGVVLDGYGCKDVRLTDDPYKTVPGEARQGGTVPGVLRAPPGFLAELKTIAPE